MIEIAQRRLGNQRSVQCEGKPLGTRRCAAATAVAASGLPRRRHALDAQLPVDAPVRGAFQQNPGVHRFQPGDADLATKQRRRFHADLQTVGLQHRPGLGPRGIGDDHLSGADPQNGIQADLRFAAHGHVATGGIADLLSGDLRDPVARQHQERHHHNRDQNDYKPNQAHQHPHRETPVLPPFKM